MHASLKRFKYEIAAVLLVKLLLIITIKMVWFSDRPTISDQAVANQLLAPANGEETQRKAHD